jgi:DNA-binding beta-propeller fold protein YncE
MVRLPVALSVAAAVEYTGEIAVFSLRRAVAGGFRPADLVGAIRTGHAPVGLAVSPDGRWLYATSEAGTSPSPVPGGHSLGGQGTLQVISLRRAETDPGRSVVVTVTAGCEPVRVITSADGSVLWVTARGSDALVAFSAARLRADPARSVISWVRTGQAPVGLALVRGGSRIVVAGSNRFAVRGASSSLAVLAVRAALAGRPAVLGYLRAGGFSPPDDAGASRPDTARDQLRFRSAGVRAHR